MIDRGELDYIVKKNVPNYFIENNFYIEQNGSILLEDDDLVITITLHFKESPTAFNATYLILIKIKCIETLIEKYIPEIAPGRKESYTYSFNKQKLQLINNLVASSEPSKIGDDVDIRHFWELIKNDYHDLLLPILPSLKDVKRIDSILNSEYLNFTKLPPEFISSTVIVLKKIISAYISNNKKYNEILNYFTGFIRDKDENSILLNIVADLDSRLKENSVD